MIQYALVAFFQLIQASSPNCTVSLFGALLLKDYLQCASFKNVFNNGNFEYMQ